MRRDDHAVGVSVEPVAGREDDAAEGRGNVDLAEAVALGAPGDGPQGFDADAHGVDNGAVAHGAVDHDPGPAVVDGQPGQVVAYQGAFQRAAAVDHQDGALAGALQRLPNQGVVVEHAEGADRTAEGRDLAEAAEGSLADLHSLGMGVAQVGGGEGHGEAPVLCGEIACWEPWGTRPLRGETRWRRVSISAHPGGRRDPVRTPRASPSVDRCALEAKALDPGVR